MRSYLITTGSITYAIKGRDVLREKGFKAKIEKTLSNKSTGCGYGIRLEGDITEAENILRSSGVKIFEIEKGV